MYYAHSRNDEGNRHDLVEHLRGVAAIAGSIAKDWGVGDLGRLIGLCHDIGKFAPSFQEYLLSNEAKNSGRRRSPDHKRAGAKYITGRKGLQALALLVQGHHGGLENLSDLKAWIGEPGVQEVVGEVLASAAAAIAELDDVAKGVGLPQYALRDPSAGEMFLRLLFSALVDADFLDTERHFQSGRAAYRGMSVAIPELWARFEQDQRRFGGDPVGQVGQTRAEIYNACLQAAEQPPGVFRLTVPTGGGKTRSAMAFALRHAMRHGHHRVVVAVPFVSITEQTAEVFREMFGRDDSGNPIVLEHHSGVERRDGGENDFDEMWTRLAAENWDAPVVVTTTVQLFESLFANTPSRCRKVHALAKSVIILDEAQALPPHLLRPILDALAQFCRHYGATVVISTATQPAFEAIPAFRDVPATEIAPDLSRFFTSLKRVDYRWLTERPLGWEEVAEVARGERQVLMVLNTKKAALALLDALGDDDALHLSTLLCGAHRRAVIAEVRRRLAVGERCRLVSTQVVEAGVDLDFPLVLRELGPLDSIIQAAGRCNREGRLERGRVVVFRAADGGTPRGAYRTATGVTEALLEGSDLDPDSPVACHKYFRQLFATVETDREGIQGLRARFDYPEVAARFRMIDDATQSVAVIYGGAKEERTTRALLDRLRDGGPEARTILRRLQPYLVSVRTREAERFRRQGLIAPVTGDLGEWLGKYDSVRGLTGDGPDPDVLVV
ncbi:MAG: CRISPR-associated helicase Cas3' [Chloroflexi bacterium]|nr:CRISPR-associated helicase Cas3' [Chloroflexota bacterium]